MGRSTGTARASGVTVSDVVFDSWAWWEVVGATPRGVRLNRRYLRNPRTRVHTSVLAVGEIVAKLRHRGDPDRAGALVPLIQSNSVLHDVTLSQCVSGARNRVALRKEHPDASLADGIMAALATELDAVLISADGAFRKRSRTKAA